MAYEIAVSEDFIALYEQQRCLWDTKSKKYCNKLARQQALKDMCMNLNLPVNEKTLKMIKAKIKNLRTTFSRELRAVKRSGAGRDEVKESKWKWFKALYFLSRYMTVTRCNCNLLVEDEQDTQMETRTKQEVISSDPSIPDQLVSVGLSSQPTPSASGLCRPSRFAQPPLVSGSNSPLPTLSDTQSTASTSGSRRSSFSESLSLELPSDKPTPTTSHQAAAARPPSSSATKAGKGKGRAKKTEDLFFEEARTLIQEIGRRSEPPQSIHFHFAMDMVTRLDSISTKNAFLARREIDKILFDYMFQ